MPVNNERIEIRMIYIFALICLSLAQQFTNNGYPGDMSTAMISTQSFTPTKSFDAVYYLGDNARNADSYAHFYYKTKVPMVNLDNFHQISNIDCSSDTITVTFKNAANCSSAGQIWNSTQALAVYIGHEHHCAGNREIATYFVASVTTVASTMTIQAIPCDSDQVIAAYELKFAHGSTGPSDGSLNKRGFFDSIQNLVTGSASSVANVVESVASTVGNGVESAADSVASDVKNAALDIKNETISLEGKIENALLFDFDGNFVIPFDLNWDSNTQTVISPAVPLLDNESLLLVCADCYSRGNTTIELHIVGIALIVTQYTLTVDGLLHANMNFDVRIRQAALNYLYRFAIFQIPLSMYTIPGVFNFGPEIRIDGGISYGTADEIELQFGFDFDVPFNFSMDSPKGFFELPSVTAGSTPTANGHKFNLSKDNQLAIGAHFIPGLYLDITVFTQKVIAVGFVIDYSIGAIVNIGNKFTLCPADIVDVTLYLEAVAHVEFYAFSDAKIFPIIDTGKIALAKHLGSTCNGAAVPAISGPVTIPEGSLAIPDLGEFNSGTKKVTLVAPRGNLTFIQTNQTPLNQTVLDNPETFSSGNYTGYAPLNATINVPPSNSIAPQTSRAALSQIPISSFVIKDSPPVQEVTLTQSGSQILNAATGLYVNLTPKGSFTIRDATPNPQVNIISARRK